MKANELRFFLECLSADLLDASAEIVAATAVDYYRDSFVRKGFDGQAWLPAHHARRPGKRREVWRIEGR